MPAPAAEELSGVESDVREHLERLVGSWGLLADLSFSDLLLYVPVDAPTPGLAAPSAPPSLQFLVFGQIRPTTSQTLFQLDLVGEVVDGGEVPVVAEAWERGAIVERDRRAEAEGVEMRTSGIPVRFNGAVVAVLSRSWSPTGGRRAGDLERTYLALFGRLASMVAAGIYPFSAEGEVMAAAPRAGDGVIVLDRGERITFTSPNAVSALHRLGIVSQSGGMTLGELGVDAPAVTSAFEWRTPGVEEIEGNGEVTVLVHCLPLIEGDGVTGAVVLLRDVTDLRRRDRLLLSKDAAMREVHHRVKNNLQTISSLLRLQSRRLEDGAARDALAEAERRVGAIALVHEILAREPGEQIHFDEIMPALIQLARGGNVTGQQIDVAVHGDAGDLVADVATPLAVVIAELLQNAVEHAFTVRGAEPARIDVFFAQDGADLAVEVRDNGAGFREGFDLDTTPSLGLAIVRALVRSQLGGTIRVGDEHGASVHLTIPLDTAAGAAR